jgi:hypothetical protein
LVVLLLLSKHHHWRKNGLGSRATITIMCFLNTMPSSWILVGVVPGIFVWLGAIFSALGWLDIIDWKWHEIGSGVLGAALAMSWVGDENSGIAFALSAVLFSSFCIGIKKQDETVLGSAFIGLFVVVILTIPGALVGFGIAAWLGTGAVNAAWVGGASGAFAVAAGWFSGTNNQNVSDRLLKRYSKSQTVLTMAITSAIGLALG